MQFTRGATDRLLTFFNVEPEPNDENLRTILRTLHAFVGGQASGPKPLSEDKIPAWQTEGFDPTQLNSQYQLITAHGESGQDTRKPVKVKARPKAKAKGKA